MGVNDYLVTGGPVEDLYRKARPFDPGDYAKVRLSRKRDRSRGGPGPKRPGPPSCPTRPVAGSVLEKQPHGGRRRITPRAGSRAVARPGFTSGGSGSSRRPPPPGPRRPTGSPGPRKARSTTSPTRFPTLRGPEVFSELPQASVLEKQPHGGPPDGRACNAQTCLIGWSRIPSSRKENGRCIDLVTHRRRRRGAFRGRFAGLPLTAKRRFHILFRAHFKTATPGACADRNTPKIGEYLLRSARPCSRPVCLQQGFEMHS